MAGIVSLDDMLTKINALYLDRKFTDVDISVFEKEHDGGESIMSLKPTHWC